MEDGVTLENLISTGLTIREGVSFVKPGPNVWRFYSVYKLADNKVYSDWKALVMMYLQYHNIDSYDQVKDLFLKFDENNYNPVYLDDILGVLKALLAFANSSPIEIVDNNVISKSRKVFIVHGHNEEYIQKVARFLEKLDCEPIILKEQPNLGNTIIEKFEDLSNAAFGVVLYTACDKGSVNNDNSELRPRARQNVIFEHGYLFAKLGRERVCALVEDGVEIPSDLAGVLYVPIDNADAWKFQLAKEMKSVGIDIDMNNII